MKIVFSLMPVLLFLTGLFLMDSFKLVNKKNLALSILWGGLAAWFSYLSNEWLSSHLSLSFEHFTRYFAPIVEEILKALFVFLLIARRKIGFSIDAAIYGFASGTGFALIENMVYIYFIGDEPSMMLWMLRGFGTALMHGGCTAIVALLIMGGIQREKKLFFSVLSGLFVAIIVHSAFNHFFLNPYLQTLLIFVMLPVFFGFIFKQSTSSLQNWLEMEFSNEVEILRMIRQGKFSGTRSGAYIAGLRAHFDSEMIVDLYNYLSLYLELSIKAKRNLMLKENGFTPIAESDTIEKLTELKALRKQVGKTGELALQPLIRIKHRELWKLSQLENS